MDSLQTWVPPQEMPYNPATTASLSSYFARPHKVVKSSSRNGSPRDLGRRKTTTAATISSRARSVVDHLRSDTQAQQWQCSESSRERPLSWHPTSIEDHHPAFDPAGNGLDLSNWSFSTAQVNGLITPISYPAINEPQMEDFFTSLEDLPGPDVMSAYDTRSFHDQTWLDHHQPKAQSYPFDMFPPSSTMPPSWQFGQGHGLGDVQTAPPSPDFLPVPGLDFGTLSLDNRGDTQDAEELVGMGLYDSPAEVQSSSLFSGTFSGRRALKLEESFEPVDQEEAEDDDDEAVEGDANLEQDTEEDGLEASDEAEYSSQSIANHLTFGMPSEVNPIAFKYLATLSQLNSAYYPAASHGYGWI